MRTAQRTVESDPTHQRAHWALAATHFHRHELDRSFVEADRAIAVNPNDAGMLAWVGGRFIFAGEGERGIALVRRAAAIDPQHPTWRYHSIAAYLFQRKKYAEALSATQKVSVPGEWWAKFYIAASHGQLGRQDEARPSVEELLSLYPGVTLQTASEELQKWNVPDEVTERYLSGLRKAGVPEAPGE